MKKIFPALLMSLAIITGCGKNDDAPQLPTSKSLKIKIKFAPNQERLDNFGNTATLPPTHAAQTPHFNGLSAHFIELVPNQLTPYKGGALIYTGEEVPASNPNSFGFTTAIDFDQAKVVAEDEVFLEIPLSSIEAGIYEHIRVSVSYQNYDVTYNLNNVPVVGSLPQQSGSIASFVGYNTHINKLRVKDLEATINAPKLQGFWGFETSLSEPYSSYNQIFTGQAPAEATTVVNPFPASPIPQGSCVVSGSFDVPLEITGEETSDIVVVFSFSINQSFEWEDGNDNQEWDIDVEDATQSEMIVDMGLRGLRAYVE